VWYGRSRRRRNIWLGPLEAFAGTGELDMRSLGVFFVAASFAAAQPQASRPPQRGGIVVELPVERPVPEMSDAEVLSGELGGTVTSVSGAEVTIEVHEPYVPRVGDRVALFRVKQGFATPVGAWKITYAEGDMVRATRVDQQETPAPGLAAIIYTGIPAGASSSVGFENTPRPTDSVEHMVQLSSRRVDLTARARRSLDDGQRYLATSPPDNRRAVESLRDAAELNHVQAAFSLFQMYAHGDPAAPDKVEAAKWLRQAAELGDAEAQYAMGEAEEGRRGMLSRDIDKARAWYRKAASQGFQKAGPRLRDMGGGQARTP
jgi:hypothetical protein